MFLMAAEVHSRFGEMNGYVCTDPTDPNAPPELPPGQTWTDTSCTWLWRPEFKFRLGAPLSWADWDGGFKFERTVPYQQQSRQMQSAGPTGMAASNSSAGSST